MTAVDVELDGRCDQQFAAVEQAFRANFGRGEIGAAVSIYVEGELVCDLRAGDARPGAPWRADTRAVTWSTSKGVLAALVAVLVDEGLLDVDKPVAEYWPEFAANGKAPITLSHVLTHTSGVPYWDGYAELVALGRPHGWDRFDDITAAIAEANPKWPSGTRMAYHALTIGWIVGEVIHRVTGLSPNDALQRFLCEPLNLDMAYGVPEHEHPNLADLSVTAGDVSEPSSWVAQTFAPDTLSGKALCVAALEDFAQLEEMSNSVNYRSAQVPGGNLSTTAESLARLYGMLADVCGWNGATVVSAETIARHTALWAEGHDLFARSHRRRALGFARPCPSEVYGPHDEAFGHAGMGGSLGFADPVSRVGFGYVMNHMFVTERLDERATTLIYALYHSLWTRQ
jgi:CubicO group peptidase (beta-lactamase class C family)